MIPRIAVDWTQVVIVLLVIDALIAAALRLFGIDPLAPHTGRHVAGHVEEHADDTRPYRVTPPRELTRAGVA